MKYQYFYQTSRNENRSGWIKARNRESAYTLLRKQGIKPYRIIGDDPVNWRPWAIGALVAALVAGLVIAVATAMRATDDRKPRPRQQIFGDASLIAAGEFSNWVEVLGSPLDRYLAAYVQPGSAALPPLMAADEIAAFESELEKGVEYVDGEPMEHRQLKNILATLRAEMRQHLASGETVGQYMDFLEERQQQEREFRDHAVESLSRVPSSHLYQAWLGINSRLRERGIATLPMPQKFEEEGAR
jgi:hypothetical protein